MKEVVVKCRGKGHCKILRCSCVKRDMNCVGYECNHGTCLNKVTETQMGTMEDIAVSDEEESEVGGSEIEETVPDRNRFLNEVWKNSSIEPKVDVEEIFQIFHGGDQILRTVRRAFASSSRKSTWTTLTSVWNYMKNNDFGLTEPWLYQAGSCHLGVLLENLMKRLANTSLSRWIVTSSKYPIEV